MKREAKRMKVKRRDLRDKIEKACTESPVVSDIFKRHNRQVTGRPRKEVDQPDLLSTIVNIVQATSATDDRRRTETLRSLTILDDLHKELTDLDFNLSCSAVYLRLLPRRCDSRDTCKPSQSSCYGLKTVFVKRALTVCTPKLFLTT